MAPLNGKPEHPPSDKGNDPDIQDQLQRLGIPGVNGAIKPESHSSPLTRQLSAYRAVHCSPMFDAPQGTLPARHWWSARHPRV
ncbi:unnamed protein product [Phytophthora fragariaefolia]|uniref:Unnamed protein product n=1 Tax=Phytophthora fragariaefolia TaxID=1490495 RepID=A0A9W6U1W2_9STRA|nr:unnamed protein product [Phytophthora fragariaefolia]